MTNTLTIVSCQNFEVSFAVADISTMKMQCTKMPVITDKRNDHESEAISYSVLLLWFLACIILHLQRGSAWLHTFQ